MELGLCKPTRSFSWLRHLQDCGLLWWREGGVEPSHVNSFGPDAALPYRRVLMADGHVRGVGSKRHVFNS